MTIIMRFSLQRMNQIHWIIKIAKESQYMLNNIKYITKFIDTEESWFDIVLNAQSSDVRLFAFDKINSKNFFERIIEESSDENIVIKAREKFDKE